MPEFKQLAPYIVIFALSFIILGGIFSPGYLVRSDNSTHLIRSLELKDNILEGKFFSWNYLDNAGSPFLTYTYILTYIIVALLGLILPVSLAYKLLLFFTFLLIPSLLYFFLSKKFRELPSLFISLLFIFHPTTIQQFLEGIWAQYLAVIFLLIFFYYLHQNSKKLTYKNVGMLSILLSLTILAHPYVGLSAVYLLGIYILLIIRNRVKAFLILVLAFLLSAFYLLPILITNYWAVSNIGWGISNSFLQSLYLSVGILFSMQSLQSLTLHNILLSLPALILDLFAVAGIIIYIKQRNNNLLKVSLLFLIISFIIGTGFWYNLSIFDFLPLKNILSSRFLIIAKLPLFIFAAFTLLKLKIDPKFFYLAIILLLISSITLFQPSKDLLKTSENSPELDDYFKTIEYLQILDLENTRIVFQSPYKVTNEGIYTPLALAPYILQAPVIGSWSDPIFPISESLDMTRGKLFNIENIPEEELVENMKLYNARYLVLTKDLNLKNFKKLTSNKFTVYELKNFSPNWIETDASYKIKQWQNPVIEIKAEKEAKILIKLAYHPFWKAYINSKEIEIKNNNDLIGIDLEKGDYTLELKYKINKSFLIISLLGLILAFWALYSRIR